MQKLITVQFWVLLIGTIFAWANFIYEFVVWLGGKTSPIACNPLVGEAEGVVNPFLTPCFYGAIMFLVAFILVVIIKKKQ